MPSFCRVRMPPRPPGRRRRRGYRRAHYQTTGGADRLMIVSTNPAVLGNRDHDRAQSDHSPVAYLGQVPVRVRGRAAVGDLIVASGQHDGTARAVHVSDWNPQRHGPIAGRASSDKTTAGVGTVTASVGGPQTAALVQRLQARRPERRHRKGLVSGNNEANSRARSPRMSDCAKGSSAMQKWPGATPISKPA